MMVELRWKIVSFALAIIAVTSGLVIGYLNTSNEMKKGENIVMGTGTIEFLDFEGGFYGIISDDGEHYDPIDLDEEFRVHSLRIYFEAEILENVCTFHMWGKPVSLLKIQILK